MSNTREQNKMRRISPPKADDIYAILKSMNRKLRFLIPCALVILSQPVLAAKPLSMPEVLAASSPSDWRPLDPENTLYVELPGGRVVVESARAFAPLHVVNIKTLARAGYFNGLSVIREQDNYVAQWGDPDNRHPLPPGIGKVAPEFDSALPAHMAFNRLPDGDVYAPEVGFSGSLPVARSEALHKVWLAHCYGMVGVGRDLDVQSGSGAGMYVVIGHAPRHLDRNVALVGRVVKGMELLACLPRRRAGLGVYVQSDSAPPNTTRTTADRPPPPAR